ncbi:MAG: YfhO family protein, partial [bacterium]
LFTIPGISLFRCPARFLSLTAFAGAVLAANGFESLLRQSSFKNSKRTLATIILLWLITFTLYGIVITNIILFKPKIIKFGKHYVEQNIFENPIHQKSLDHYLKMVDRLYDQIYNSLKISNPDIYIPIILSLLGLVIIGLQIREIGDKNRLSVLLLLLVIIDLFWFGSKSMANEENLIKLERYHQSSEIVQFLKKDYSLFRIGYLNKINEIEYKNQDSFLDLLLPEYHLMHNISSISGNLNAPLLLTDYINFLDRIYTLEDIPSRLKLLGLLNVKYLLSTKRIENKYLDLVYEKKKVHIYKNRLCLPRIFISYRWEKAKKEKIFDILCSKNFSPRRQLIIDSKETILSNPRNCYYDSVDNKINIIRYQNNRIELFVTMKNAGLIFLSDVYYPGWKVLVDGKEKKILQANDIFRAVYLTKGMHELVFKYDPMSFKIGLYISFLTTVGMIIVLISL